MPNNTIQLKTCKKCHNKQPYSNFSKCKSLKDGLQSKCKECQSQEYRSKKDYWSVKEKENRKKNSKLREEYAKNYFQKNKAKILKQRKERFKRDPKAKMAAVLRTRLYEAVFKNSGGNKGSMKYLLGCSIDDLLIHLENQFVEGMSLSNHGEWHIDHIIPCASFDLTDIEQQKKCFHYTNLQPLWAKDNISKGAKLFSPLQVA